MDNKTIYIISHLFIGIILALKWTKNDDLEDDGGKIIFKYLFCLLGGWVTFAVASIKFVIINDWDK